MDFYDVIEKRRSVRKFKEDAVEKEKMYRILESLTLAPSWSCKHCWKLIVVDKKDIKDKILQCVNESNPAREGILEAPIVVVICADPVSTEEIDGKEYYMADCGIVMEHFMLAASNEGLSTCWIGLLDEDRLKSILNIPDMIRIVALSPLGYSNEIPDERIEKGIKDITYYNRWEEQMSFTFKK